MALTGPAVRRLNPKPLGRRPIKLKFNHGKYQYVIHHDNKVSCCLRFKYYFDRSKDIAPPPVTTAWLQAGMTAIAMTYGNTVKGD